MEERYLLYHFAQAVARMREMQKVQSKAFPELRSPLIEELEREVDDLTILHLLPPVPNAPYISKAGG